MYTNPDNVVLFMKVAEERIIEYKKSKIRPFVDWAKSNLENLKRYRNNPEKTITELVILNMIANFDNYRYRNLPMGDKTKDHQLYQLLELYKRKHPNDRDVVDRYVDVINNVELKSKQFYIRQFAEQFGKTQMMVPQES